METDAPKANAKAVTYNLRCYPGYPSPHTVKDYFEWFEAEGVEAKLYRSYDGGGDTGVIAEFKHLNDLRRFFAAFADSVSDQAIWAEDEAGRHIPIEGAD